MGAWCVKYNTRNEWFQIDFQAASRISKISTQGRHDADQWVTTYRLSFSTDGANFAIYKEGYSYKVNAALI